MTVSICKFNAARQYLLDGSVDFDTSPLMMALVSATYHPIIAWAASTAYGVGAYRQAAAINGHYYKCTVAGTSGTSEPTWPTDGGTVADGTATWQDMGTALPASGGVHVGWVGNIADWAASTAYALDDRLRPTTPNGHWYKCTVAGTSNASEPTWPTDGGTVADGTATWQDMGINPAACEITGTGYSQGGVALSSPVASYDEQYGYMDFADPTWSGSTLSARWAILYRSGTVNGVENPLLAGYLLNNTPADVSTAGSDLVLQVAPAGLIRSA